jgi:hypothetical protein
MIEAKRWPLTALLAGLCMTAMIAGWLAQAPPSNADAGCSTNNRNAAAYQSGGGKHRGVQVTNPGMATFAAYNGCAHYSTLQVHYNQYKFMEIGWATIGDTAADDCDHHDDGVPHFYLAYYGSTGFHCKTGAAISPDDGGTDSYHSYTIKDDAENGEFTFWKDGSQWCPAAGCTITTSWTVGYIVSNGERHILNDSDPGSMAAHFHGLRYETDQGWGPWDTDGIFCDDSNDFDNVFNADGNGADWINVEQTDSNLQAGCGIA